MKKKLVSALLCVAMVATMLAGCGGKKEADSSDEGGSGSSGEIYMFISQPEYADAINTLIEEYKTVEPDVTINYETTQNDYPTLLKAKLNSGDTPDIFSSTSGKEIEVYKEYSYDLSDQPLMDSMLPAVADTMKDANGEGVYGIAIKGNYFGLCQCYCGGTIVFSTGRTLDVWVFGRYSGSSGGSCFRYALWRISAKRDF